MKIGVGLVTFGKDRMDKAYAFYTDMEGLQKDEPVIVDTENGYAVAFFQEYTNNSKAGRVSKWIVQKVNVCHHVQMMTEQARLEKLKTEIEQRRATLEQEAIYELLAKNDPTLANLLAEYKKAGGKL